MYLGIRETYLFFWSHFNKISGFSKNPQISDLIKVCSVETESLGYMPIHRHKQSIVIFNLLVPEFSFKF